MSVATQAEAVAVKQSSVCSPALSVLGQAPNSELKKVQNRALHVASRQERRNGANTVIVLCSLAILILFLGLLELHIRQLTKHSAQPQFGLALHGGRTPVRRMCCEAR